ncbi:Neopullulanase [Streptococcus sp. ZB199]|nr:Neopullulanase [Streptococcus sp. ZB199]
MYLLWNGASLIGDPDPDCRRVMPWERVSADNDMLNFMKDLIQLRKEVAGMIQYGKVSLEEVELDVVAVEWQHEGHILKAYFNHSKTDFVLEREQADLISHGSISDDLLIIQPNGFVIYRED